MRLRTFLVSVIVSVWVSAYAGPALLRAQEDAGSDASSARAEGYAPRPSEFGKAPRDLDFSALHGGKVLRVPIEGTVDLGLSALISRVFARKDAQVVVLDINTLGGRIDAAIQIRDQLLASRMKTIAFVHPRAISAGALIALACDVIVVSDGASIGAATPITMGEGGAQPVSEKMVSYFRTEMRSTAEAKHRRGDLAEAMVDASVFIPGIDPADKLLTLDTDAALKLNVADARANDLHGALAAVHLPDALVEDLPENWAEKLVRFLTDSVVSGLLMSLGSLGLLIELYHPGALLPALVGVVCLSLFFGGHLLVHLAGLEELVLLAVGVVLLALEVFVIPGFGAVGVTGIVCIIASLMLSTVGLPLNVLFKTGAWVEPLTRVAIAMSLTLVGMIVAFTYLPRSRALNRLVLSSTLASNTHAQGPASFVSADESGLASQLGIAESDLRPVGVARFGERRVDVVTEGGYVTAGSRVRVVAVQGARVVVRVEPSESVG